MDKITKDALIRIAKRYRKAYETDLAKANTQVKGSYNKGLYIGFATANLGIASELEEWIKEYDDV